MQQNNPWYISTPASFQNNIIIAKMILRINNEVTLLIYTKDAPVEQTESLYTKSLSSFL